MTFMRSTTVGFALALGVANAHAQNVISRQVASEPVETIVTQTPGGTIVTRRPFVPPVGDVTIDRALPPARDIGAVELQPNAAPPYPPAPPATYGDDLNGMAAARSVRAVTVQRPIESAPVRIRSVRATETRVRTTRHATRTAQHAAVRRTAQRTGVRRLVGPPLVLDPAQRQIVYRTVVQQQVIPAMPAYPAYPDYPGYRARTVVVPPSATTGYAVSMPSYQDFDDDVAVEQVPSAIDPVRYGVGSQLPAGYALSPLPASVALQVPSIRPYGYVTIGNRVLLVDPVTNVVVADITP